MSDITHYSLEVRQLVGIQRTSERRRYNFKIGIGGKDLETGEIKENGLPAWNSIVTFSSSIESSILKFCVIERYKWRNSCIASVDVGIPDLLGDYADGKNPLDLIASGGSSQVPACSVYLCLKEIDEASRAEIDVKCAEQDIKRIERSASVANPADAVGSVVEIVDRIIESIDDIVGDIHPYLKLAWIAAAALYKVVSHQWQTDKKLVGLVDAMQAAYEFARDAIALRDKASRLEESIGELRRHTLQVCYFVREYTSRSFIGRILRVTNAPKMDEYKEKFIALRREVDSGIAVHNARISERIDLRQQLHLRLQELKDLLEPIKSETSGRPRCLPKTRTEYLRQIKSWLFTPTDENILWLNGVAGSGKSTIAASILDYCDDSSRLAAYLFFERGKSDPRSVIRTIAYQLAAFESTVAERLPTAAELKNVNGLSLSKQFEKLLWGPLSDSVSSIRGPIIIILDALDECGSTEQRREILELMKTGFRKLPLEFRFFLTSRPENDIMQSLAKRSHILEIKLEPNSVESREDVRTYINDAMCKAVVEPIPDVSMWANTMDILGRAADGLFVWASTAVKVVTNSDDPFGKLEELVCNIHSLNGLDNLYSTVLEQSGISWEDSKSVDRFCKVFGLVLFGKVPVSDDDIDNILGLGRGKSRLTLQRLHSVLSYEPGKAILLHHTSFSDYLLSSERSGNQKWFIDRNNQNDTLATRCFDVMERSLWFNICDLETSSIFNDEVPDLEDRIVRNIPSCLSYTCRFWADHLRDALYSQELADKLTTFAYKRLLYWFEVLSLTKHFNRVVGRALMNAISWIAGHDSGISSFLIDASKVASTFAIPVTESTPHIYVSMLPMMKDESQIAAHYSKQTSRMVQVNRMGTKRPPLWLKVLEGHSRSVLSVTFSPDGRHIASGSDDGTVRIWDVDSGETVYELCEQEYPSGVMSVAFSPDGRCIASGHWNSEVRIWDLESGEVVLAPFRGHTNGVWAVAFSPGGKYVAWCSEDTRIRVWDVRKGTIDNTVKVLKGHAAAVQSIVFSHDGKRIVSGSDDKTVRVWDAKTRKTIGEPFVGHTRHVHSVAISPDDRHIVSGSLDCSVRVWNTENGHVVNGPFWHSDAVYSVTFSPDGKHILSGSVDRTVIVWDMCSGEVVSGPFTGHTNRIHSVAFSPDGSRIVSGSKDKTVRLWDASISKVTPDPSIRHTDSIHSVSFAPDGSYIVSGSRDSTIRLWDSNTGEAVSTPFEGHKGAVTSVTFSPDGRRIASGSADKSVIIWDIKSKEIVLGPFKRHLDIVSSVAFSPDGTCVVSGSCDRTIVIWNAENGDMVAESKRVHKAAIVSVAFSPDGIVIASASIDNCVIIWQAENAKFVLGFFDTLKLPKDIIGIFSPLAFSADGKRIASRSSDTEIIIWDTQSGQIVNGPFKGHFHEVSSVAFSPDGKYVVSGSYDRSFIIWNASNGDNVGRYQGHSSYVNCLEFSKSTDRMHLVTGSADRTIRIWDITNMEDLSVPKGATSDNAFVSSSSKERGGVGFADWTLADSGWVEGSKKELLLWVPPDSRSTLWRPQNTAVFSCEFSTKLNFRDAAYGPCWHECFTPDN